MPPRLRAAALPDQRTIEFGSAGLRPAAAYPFHPDAEFLVGEAARNPLAAWENFYIIVGSSAGALTGLQFVVIALIAESRARPTPPEIAAFGTPTILHFCAALLVSCLVSAPWPSLALAGLGLAPCGVAGVVYAVVVVRRARRQEGYRPVLEDWLRPSCCRAIPGRPCLLLPRRPSGSCSSAFIIRGTRSPTSPPTRGTGRMRRSHPNAGTAPGSGNGHG